MGLFWEAKTEASLIINMKTNEEKRAFYARCGEILGIEHDWNEPVKRRNRWNTRKIGNGRYPGFGLIHCYGSCVRVISRDGTKMFDDYEQVYDYLLDRRQKTPDL